MPARRCRLVCPTCGEPVDGSYTPSFDVEAEPRLLEKLLAGRLNRLTCPICRHSGLVPEPVVLRVPSRNAVIGFMPVEVPHNRKSHLARRLADQLAERATSKGRQVVCFGMRQLHHELSATPWKRGMPEFHERFDNAGTPAHRARCLAKAAKVRPDDPLPLARLGAALYDDGEVGRARETLEQALALDPDQLDALYCLGSVSLDQGRPEEALRLYDRVVAATHEPLPRFLAGVAALRAGRADHALVRLRQAARDDPTLVDAHVWEAAAHVALGDDRAAVAALRRAVENGLRDPGAITSRPEFAALRSRPGFTALVSLLKRLHGSEGKPRRTDRRASDRPGRRSPRPTWPRARR